MTLCPHCAAPQEPGAQFCARCGQSLGSARKGGRFPKVVLIPIACGCLVLLVVGLGIVAALVIPNFVDAVQKAKQKRTMADMRQIGLAIESYRDDVLSQGLDARYPYAGSIHDLEPLLVPNYLSSLPAQDGWDHDLMYVCRRSDPVADGCDSFLLVSAGRNGRVEHTEEEALAQEEAFPRNDYDHDIVFASGGVFPQAPARGSG